MKVDLLQGEEVVFKSPATLERDPIRHDGKLFLTNKRLHFEGIEKVGWTYLLNELAKVKVNNILWLAPKGILVSFADGFVETILVEKRERWVEKIILAKAMFESPCNDADSGDEPLTVSKRRMLRIHLENNFNEEELQNLCLDLNVDFENLTGNTKAAKARELLLQFERSGKVEELIEWCKAERPMVNWDG